MAKAKRPKNELTQLEARNLYHGLEKTVLADWSREEVNKLADSSLNLNFAYANTISKKNEPILWLGILLKGDLLLSIGTEKIGMVHPFAVLNYTAALQGKKVQTQTFDITAMSNGVLSLFYFEDLLNLPKKQPKIALKFYEFLGKTTVSSIFSQFFQSPIQLTHIPNYIEYSTRRKQEFINMHPCFSNTLDLARIDIKVLASVFKVIHPQENVFITKKGHIDDSVFFVVQGKTGIFEEKVFEENIFGIENFLKPGLEWKHSVVAVEHSTILALPAADFADVVGKHGGTAAKFVKILANVYAKQVFDRKTQNVPVDLATSQDFIEIDVATLCVGPKLVKITEESEDETENAIPLYTFPMFEAATLPNKTIAEPLEFVFFKEKLAKQVFEVEAKKKARKGPSIPSPRPHKLPQKQPGLSSHFSEISKALNDLEKENLELEKKIQELEEENEKINSEINEEFLEVERKNVV